MSELIMRSIEAFELREESNDEMSLTGIAVPWGQTITVGDYQEKFERGAFDEYDGSAVLFSNHGHRNGDLPIGRVESAEDTEDGLLVKARISATDRGREVYRLLKDGVLKALSIGFEPIESRDEEGVTVRTRAKFREVSVVWNPAYSQAVVSQVRDEQNPTPEVREENHMTENATDLVEVRDSLEDVTRRLAVVEGSGPADSAVDVRFNSLGEFVKGLATRTAGREDAELLERAFTGATTTNSNPQNAWINRDVKLVDENRDILNLFSRESLPSGGMTIEYPKFGSKTGDVAEQAAQGDDLSYLSLTVTDANAPVKTYGGYSSLSRQAIERSDVAYLNKVLRMQAISYAKVTNAAVLASLTAATGTGTGTVPASATAVDWVNVALDGLADISDDSQGLAGDVWVMGRDSFKGLASVVDDTGRPIFAVNGDGSNTFGNVDLKGLRAVVAGVPVVVSTKLTGASSYIVSREAITVLESAGAPWRLSDENIINLTKDFSLYGYMAITVNDAKGIVKVTHATGE